MIPTRIFFARSVLFLLITHLTRPHGFGADTLIWTGDWKTMQTVCEEIVHESVPHQTPSYDIARGLNISRAEFQQRVQDGWVRINGAARSVTNCYMRITLGTRLNETILCTPLQEFYVPALHRWVSAIDLESGYELLNSYGGRCTILEVELVMEPLEVYAISVDVPHTYFISICRVLTHNIFLPAVECTAAVPWDLFFTGGRFALELGPLTCGISIALAAGAGIGYALYKWSKGSPEIATYGLTFNPELVNSYFRDKSQKPLENDKSSAQAPGMPTENDGYLPPKNWDGEKVRNPKGGKFGWPDKNGNVWIPTGPKAHRGPHWDVQNPKTGRHTNVLPGGKSC